MLVIVAVAYLSLAAHAYAGQAATDEPAFQPCTKCHPVTLDSQGNPTKPLPNDFEKHEITLEVHDILGEGDAACLQCHDEPSKNPGKLLLADGSFVDITGDVSRVCQRCHFQKYRDWTIGIHGRGEAKCSSAGCHDPHTPSWIYVPALQPFLGTGTQVRAVNIETREPFTPFAGPPVDPPVYTPTWLAVLTAVGTLASLGVIGLLVSGRLKR